MNLQTRLREFDQQKREKLQMVGHFGRWECDCGIDYIHFYWSWYAGFESIECGICGKIKFDDYYFLQ